MPNYELPFAVFEYVNITAINYIGRISCIKISGHDIYFTVEYWWEGSIRVVQLLSDEMTKVVNNE